MHELLYINTAQDYQDELFKLKEEFEKYKTRAQLVLKGKGKKVIYVMYSLLY